MIDTIRLIRNVGTFDSVAAGAQLPFNRFALVYAENGRGKTTLAAILRSLGSGEPQPILERRRLTAAHPPHVVIAGNGGQEAVFQNGAWSNTFDDIAVFDDQFVSDNVCSGMQIGPTQRQRLHELIIGARGVALSQSLQGHVDRVEQHNRDLQVRANQVPAEARGGMATEAFCDLEPRHDLDTALQEAERNLAAATDADAVRQRAVFDPITLPDFDLASVEELLTRGLAELEAEAAARVQAHLAKLGSGAETWVSDGMRRIGGASADQGQAICPFCAQSLDRSPLIAHYRVYFSAAYRDLRDAIERAIYQLNTDHRAEIQAAFERAIRVTSQTQQFWARFADVPAVDLDTASIARLESRV